MGKAFLKQIWRATNSSLLMVFFLLLSGCLSQEEDLRGVPVTNNPSLNPWGSTAQGPMNMGSNNSSVRR